MPLSSLTLPVLSLAGAMLLYALAGSPTPDNHGIVEIVIGALLVFSVVATIAARQRFISDGGGAYAGALLVFFAAGLVLPSISGAYLGNDRILMLRDIIAFAFLGLPVFLSGSFTKENGGGRILYALAIFAGLAFCVRTLLPALNFWIPQGELLYLSNSPLSMFAAVYLAGLCWISLESPTRRNLLVAILSLGGLGVVMAAMMLDVQRATVGAVWITWAVLAIHTLLFRPRRLLWPVVLIGSVCAASYPLIGEAFSAMAVKTSQVGFNARIAEALAVYRELAANPLAMAGGLGWGASFNSPAVGGLPVNFTHSLLTTMALKGGLVLFALAVALVLAGLHRIFLIFQQDRVSGLALFWAFVVPVFLYASHKSLDFGLILLMIGMWSNSGGPLHKSHSSVNT